ncbi:MAG: hypothetical protein ABIG96_03975 [Candidatus Micrarchaeota archaeon]
MRKEGVGFKEVFNTFIGGNGLSWALARIKDDLRGWNGKSIPARSAEVGLHCSIWSKPNSYSYYSERVTSLT